MHYPKKVIVQLRALTLKQNKEVWHNLFKNKYIICKTGLWPTVEDFCAGQLSGEIDFECSTNPFPG